jgi:DNA-binding transcriptional LysR family regulator
MRVEGQLVFSKVFHMLDAALDGFGRAHLPAALAESDIATDLLVAVPEGWCPHWSGYHLYRPSRRQPPSL